MIDSKTVVTQVQELQVIILDLLADGINLFSAYVANVNLIINTHIIFNRGFIVNVAFYVASIIQKLPLLWKDLKNYWKHKRKKMTVDKRLPLVMTFSNSM